MNQPVNERTLNQLKEGEQGVISHYVGESEIQGRLKELGLVRGTRVLVKRFAPLGDPMEIEVRGYHLALRKKDAACIVLRVLGAAAFSQSL